jgi:hypothetical protein
MPFRLIELGDEASCQSAIDWWHDLTNQGGEGMVVKPLDFLAQRPEEGLGKEKPRWVQPGVKRRGREYLRIIYGPEYTRAENIERLRSRSLAGKRSLALREWVLGLESLERFVAREPLRRVHECVFECVFGVLALESSLSTRACRGAFVEVSKSESDKRPSPAEGLQRGGRAKASAARSRASQSGRSRGRRPSAPR